MARKQDKKRRSISQAQKQRQKNKLVAPEAAPQICGAPAIAEARAIAVQPSCASSPESVTESLLLTVADLCALLSISRASFYRLQKTEPVPGRVVLAGHIRFHRPTVENWLSAKAKGETNVT